MEIPTHDNAARRQSGIGARLRAYAEKDGRGYPDWAMRYLPVLRRVGGLDWNTRCSLEIGANENGLARFTGSRTIAVDIEMDQLRAARTVQRVLPICADIGALPFRPDTFDVVVCMDTFEHIPKSRRGLASREIVRVLNTGGVAVIAFPSGEAAFAAESQIREEFKALTGESIRWLEEHVAMGLPDADRIRADLTVAAGEAYRVTQTGNASLPVWTWMWRVLMCQWPGRGNALFQVMLRWLVPVLSRLHFGTCYRAMLWVFPADRTP